MTQFHNAVQIADYMRSNGFKEASTGGGFSAWIFEAMGNTGKWQILVADWEADNADIQPERAIGIGLYLPDGGDGLEEKHEVIENAGQLPDALLRFRQYAVDKFGLEKSS